MIYNYFFTYLIFKIKILKFNFKKIEIINLITCDKLKDITYDKYLSTQSKLTRLVKKTDELTILI